MSEPEKLKVMELRPHDQSIVITGPWDQIMALFKKIDGEISEKRDGENDG